MAMQKSSNYHALFLCPRPQKLLRPFFFLTKKKKSLKLATENSIT